MVGMRPQDGAITILRILPMSRRIAGYRELNACSRSSACPTKFGISGKLFSSVATIGKFTQHQLALMSGGLRPLTETPRT